MEKRKPSYHIEVMEDFIKEVTSDLRLEGCSSVLRWMDHRIPDREASVYKGVAEIKCHGSTMM
jgi:hypothetical protein